MAAPGCWCRTCDCDEAQAARQYLVAYARGDADEFWRRETRSAALVATVAARGLACDEREVDGELSAGVG